MDAKELANETYVKRMKIWETEDDRDIGESELKRRITEALMVFL